MQNEIIFLSFPIVDRNIPSSFKETELLIKSLKGFIDENKKVVVHCRQGIGRSSLIAACVLILQDIPVTNVFNKIAKARNCNVPDTEEQVDWVKLFAEKVL